VVAGRERLLKQGCAAEVVAVEVERKSGQIGADREEAGVSRGNEDENSEEDDWHGSAKQ
jgi:hypothetical protein